LAFTIKHGKLTMATYSQWSV